MNARATLASQIPSPPAHRSGALREMKCARIVRAVASAAERWRDADFPPRVRATRAVGERTGYSEPVIDYALDALFAEVREETLRDTIVREVGTLDAVDGFIAASDGPQVWARGVDRVAIVSSETTIGVALFPALFALCAKCDVVVKDRSDGLLAAFALTLAQEGAEFAHALRAEAWNAGDAHGEAHLRAADVVVAFGGDDALAALRASCAPGARFVGFGRRTSAGYIAASALAERGAVRELADAAARDALLYDGEGCLSLHALFVERGGPIDVATFARELAAACERTLVEFPSERPLDPRALALHRSAAFRAALQRSPAAFGGAPSGYVLLVDPPRDEAPPLHARTFAVYGVDGPSDAAGFVQRHALPLEALALAPGQADPAAFEAFGATRIARLGALQRPPLGGTHGGEGRMLPFVRFRYRD